MDLARVFRHLLFPGLLVRRAFPATALSRIEAAIAASESRHRGQIRYAVEGALDLRPLIAGQTARERAIEVFSALHIWDTEENNGVLIYLLLADRDVEIVADRAIARHVGPAGFEAICRRMEEELRAGRFARGVVEGIEAVGQYLALHYPARGERHDELPDAPVILSNPSCETANDRMSTTPSRVTLPTDREPTLRIVPMPADTNFAGNIFGGWILSQVDIAGSIPAIRRARGRVTTVAVNSVEFHEPVFVGDLVSCYAEVVRVGRTSLTVQVDVYAERNPARVECIRVTQAVLTFVAIDENRRPRVVPRKSNPRKSM